MAVEPEALRKLTTTIVEKIDIPKSYYERAAGRHKSVGEWLLRPESRVARYDPDIRPQGSFRFGTVNLPINYDDEYDLDHVCVMKLLKKTETTQKELKELYGLEIADYAKAHDMRKPVTEHKRCWRLQYSDTVKFHLETLPCVPEEFTVQIKLMTRGVSHGLAERAVAITDKRDPNYERVSATWPSSNPRGFAKWFEEQAAKGRVYSPYETRAVVESVPTYEWKTTLQQSIQLLKRHRDVMFSDSTIAELAPISMVITNLAAKAYGGETDLFVALRSIVEKMESFINAERPLVPNPADPAEDYADKWSRDPRLKKAFYDWHSQVRADIQIIPTCIEKGTVKAIVRSRFRVDLSDEELRRITAGASSPSVVTKAPSVISISSAPKPWRR
jgi:hypothetical protein